MNAPSRLFLAALLAGTALTLPAHAEDVPPAVQAVFDNFERQTGIEPDYENIETDSDGNVTVTKMTVKVEGKDGSPPMAMTIDSLGFEDIEDQGDGLYEIGSSSFEGMKLDVGTGGETFSIAMPAGSAEGWFVKVAADDASPEETLRASMNVARKMSSGPMSVTAMGQTFTSEGFEQTWDGDPKTGAGDYAMHLKTVTIPEPAIAALDQMGIMKQLGYQGLTFDITSKGKTTIADGNMDIDFNFAYVGKDMGTLGFSANANSIPMAAYAELQNAGDSGKAPDFTALMPQLQAITINGVSLRFDDSSLVKRLLPMAAKMQGMDEATLITTAGAMAQMGLMQLQNQAFSDQAGQAISAFLKDPKSITIAAKPSAPVKVSELMALDPAKPGDAITKLGVTVTAND